MTTIRGYTFQASPSLSSNPNNTITLYLRSSSNEENSMTDKFNILLGDSSAPIPQNIELHQFNIFFIIIICLACIFILYNIKDIILTFSPQDSIKNNYKIIPFHNLKKAKESPFILPMQTPHILPDCPRLESAERGQNMMVKFSIPYRRFQSSNNLQETNDEDRITITTLVGQSKE
jgi:hypothetical protein